MRARVTTAQTPTPAAGAVCPAIQPAARKDTPLTPTDRAPARPNSRPLSATGATRAKAAWSGSM